MYQRCINITRNINTGDDIETSRTQSLNSSEMGILQPDAHNMSCVGDYVAEKRSLECISFSALGVYCPVAYIGALTYSQEATLTCQCCTHNTQTRGIAL